MAWFAPRMPPTSLDLSTGVALPRNSGHAARWLSAIYRGTRDTLLLCAAEAGNWGQPPHYQYRIDGLELTVRRWTTDRLIVDEVIRKIAYPLPRQGQIILDLGAHIGTFSLLAARAGARVIAFEPEASNFALLSANVRAYPAIEAVPLAVAGASGSRTLGRQSRFTTSGWSLCTRAPDALQIECISLPEIWRQWRLEAVDLLKMNVEGAEYEIIRQLPIAYLRQITRVFVECHDFHGFDLSELTGRLRRAGFEVRTRPQASYRLTKIAYIDAVRPESRASATS
jgi:FkbM family methyltransferase